jgi:hypothetical protein
VKPTLRQAALLLSVLPACILAAPHDDPQHAELGQPKETAVVAPVADPTRPPAGWGHPQAASAAAPSARPQVAPPPQLASIRVGGALPPSAVISGQLVHVGERVDDATVTAIDPSGVTLRTARGLVRLAIAPEVIKSPMGTPSQSGLAGRKEAR